MLLLKGIGGGESESKMVSKEVQNVINLLRQSQASAKATSVKEVRAGLEQLASTAKLEKDVKCELVDAG